MDSIVKTSIALTREYFFDLIDVTHVNSDIVYMKLDDDISLLNFKIVLAKALKK